MKKLLLLFAAVGMIFTACEAGGGLDEGGNGTPASSDKIATIEEQGANIKATITTLETTKSAVNSTIASLNEQQPVTRGENNNGVKDMIAALEERLAALEQMIANLKEYADGDLPEMQDWAEATFATMEQYNALASELATLKALLEGFEGVSTAELSDALVASEQSMKQWVNEQLSGYATIAEVEAQIAALKESLTAELNEEIEKVVATLTALMNDTKQEYEKAIADAIQNQGIINDKIAEDIANINNRIDEELATINKRLDDIEKRLGEIEEALANLINRIQSLEYIDSNGDEPTPVVTSAEATTVQLNFIVSPSKAAGELAANWREYVKVKAYYTDDINTIVDLPITSYTGNGETGVISIEASGENLSDRFYTDLQQASLYLKISDGNTDKISASISIKAQQWFRENVKLPLENNEIYYLTTDNSVLSIGGSGFGAKMVSNMYDWRKGCFALKFDNEIISIGTGAFSDSCSLVSIAIPDSVTSIGESAFYGCTSLTSITIPDSVTSIGESAFYGCTSLTSVTIPNSVVSIGRMAFAFCTGELTVNCNIPSASSCGSAFYQSKFTKVTIGNSVTSIGDWAFESCDSLTRVDIFDLSAWCKIDFASILANPLIYADTLYLNGVEVTELTIPLDITEIKSFAFCGCDSMISVTIPDSVTSIGEGAFYECFSLTSITIPNSVTSIGDSAFYYCRSLTSVTIGNSVTSIGDWAFHNCTSLTSVTIPDSVTSIGNSVFYRCSKLTSVTIGNSVTSIGVDAFSNCTSLTSVTIGNSVTSIESKAFEKCTSLTSVTIPDGVTSIGYRAFSGCVSLTSVIIPDSVTAIGMYAFRNCTSLTSVYCKPITPPTGNSDMFSYVTNVNIGYKPLGCKIYVPRNSVEAYKTAEYWSNYADYIEGYDF